jgi:hypothetical protein
MSNIIIKPNYDRWLPLKKSQDPGSEFLNDFLRETLHFLQLGTALQ